MAQLFSLGVMTRHMNMPASLKLVLLFALGCAPLSAAIAQTTAVGACSSAIAVHAASRRWLSFFR